MRNKVFTNVKQSENVYRDDIKSINSKSVLDNEFNSVYENSKGLMFETN